MNNVTKNDMDAINKYFNSTSNRDNEKILSIIDEVYEENKTTAKMSKEEYLNLEHNTQILVYDGDDEDNKLLFDNKMMIITSNGCKLNGEFYCILSEFIYDEESNELYVSKQGNFIVNTVELLNNFRISSETTKDFVNYKNSK